MFAYLADSYFTNLVLAAIIVSLLVIGLKNFTLLGNLKIFLLYCALALLQTILALIIIQYDFDGKTTGSLIEYSINVFMVAEFLIFYYFIYSIVRSAKAKLLLIALAVSFVTGVVIQWMTSHNFARTPDRQTVVEAFLILLPCLYYFYETLSLPPTTPLLRQPTFWAVTGMLFLFSIIVPFYLIKESLIQTYQYLYNSYYTINYLAYILFYSCLLNSYVCKVKSAKY